MALGEQPEKRDPASGCKPREGPSRVVLEPRATAGTRTGSIQNGGRKQEEWVGIYPLYGFEGIHTHTSEQSTVRANKKVERRYGDIVGIWHSRGARIHGRSLCRCPSSLLGYRV